MRFRMLSFFKLEKNNSEAALPQQLAQLKNMAQNMLGANMEMSSIPWFLSDHYELTL